MKKIIAYAFIVLVFSYLVWLVRPLFLRQLGGTFQTHTVPSNYQKLATVLTNDKIFSRTLWIPTTERYGFFSFVHPFISSYDLFNTSSISATLAVLHKPNEEKILSEESIKYIIVPEDTDKEIFLQDRKYDNAQYLSTVKAVQKIPWLHELPGFGKVHVYVINNAKNRFWTTNSSTKITYAEINPTLFSIKLTGVHSGDKLIFTDAYDSGWILQKNETVVSSKPYNTVTNSFILPKSGDYTVQIFFKGQKWVDIGLWISGISFVLLVCLSIALLMKTRK